MRPVPHSDDLPVPTPPVNKDLLFFIKWRNAFKGGFCRVNIFGRYWVYIFRNKWQWAILDHARRPEWSCSWFVSVKQQSELLASRLKQWNLVQEDVRVTSFIKLRKSIDNIKENGFTLRKARSSIYLAGTMVD